MVGDPSEIAGTSALRCRGLSDDLMGFFRAKRIWVGARLEDIWYTNQSSGTRLEVYLEEKGLLNISQISFLYTLLTQRTWLILVVRIGFSAMTCLLPRPSIWTGLQTTKLCQTTLSNFRIVDSMLVYPDISVSMAHVTNFIAKMNICL